MWSIIQVILIFIVAIALMTLIYKYPFIFYSSQRRKSYMRTKCLEGIHHFKKIHSEERTGKIKGIDYSGTKSVYVCTGCKVRKEEVTTTQIFKISAQESAYMKKIS